MTGLDCLPWFAPSGAALAAIARPTSSFWPSVRHDPAAVLWLLRFGEDPIPPQQSTLLRATLAHLDQPPIGLLNWDEPATRPLFDTCWTLARLTAILARRTRRCDEIRAWCCGLLAPLGWLATLATTGERPEGDATPLARRLLRHWQLPAWLREVLSHLSLPAGTLGGEAPLIALVRLALHLWRGRGLELHLLHRHEPLDADAALLGLTLEALDAEALLYEDELRVPAWSSPYEQPLLREVLALAADNHDLRGGAEYQRLEAEVDRLHQALREQIRSEADRLRLAKLAALGEFAAGAGHEINNPLAIISGQAQYVLSHADDWLISDDEGHTLKALQTIINQTKRIHGLLRDLMQFARPAAARPSYFDLPTLIGEVVAGMRELAQAREIRLELEMPERLEAWADPTQVGTALQCLVKNAVEAAPVGGWVRVRLDPCETLDIWVEDSGPGPSPEQRPHLFDPFYSGRNAGRGKGFGLPVAWRLARQQGGDVRFETPRPGRPTRFVLSLPRDDDNHRCAA
ncbi:MAG: ATP-binding protein [Gemmataceae bacterium]